MSKIHSFFIIQSKDPDSPSVPKAMSKLGKPELSGVRLMPYLLDFHFLRQLQIKNSRWFIQKVILYEIDITWKHLERRKGCREVANLHKINFSWQNTGNQTGKCKLLVNFWESMNLIMKIQPTKENPPTGPQLASKISGSQCLPHRTWDRETSKTLHPDFYQCHWEH